MTFSDFFKKHYDGYRLDSKQRIRATTAKTISLKNLTNLMRSKDRELYE